MSLRDCFTVDLKARGKPALGAWGTVKRLLLNPGYRAVAYYRLAVYLRRARLLQPVPRIVAALLLARLARVPGVEFHPQDDIGPGLLLPHPHDIVIGAGSRIGRNVTIFNGVTLGARTLRHLDECQEVEERYPTIEDGVTIFPGARVLGPVTIGASSIVGANSVVTQSFPAGSTIVGAPARAVQKAA